jgi:hypothetical protein
MTYVKPNSRAKPISGFGPPSNHCVGATFQAINATKGNTTPRGGAANAAASRSGVARPFLSAGVVMKALPPRGSGGVARAAVVPHMSALPV